MVELNGLSDNVINTISDKTGEDITDEIELDVDDVKICKISELVPSSTPITIPYMEIFRTNELEFIPYISPYNVGAQSDSSTDTGDDMSVSSTDSNSGDSANSDNSTNSDSNDSSQSTT